MSNNIYTALFYFMNEEVSVIEVKRTDIPEDSDKDKMYHWLKYTQGSKKIERLRFRSMSSEVVNGNNINIRAFADGELRFDKDFAKFLHCNDGHLIMNRPVQDIPDELSGQINSFLSSL